jgi:hypothetical protein
MIRSSTYRLLIVVLILLTLVWKIAIPADSSDDLDLQLTAFFARNGFEVFRTNETVNYFPIIHATAGACSIEVAKVTPDGSNGDLIQSKFSKSDHIFIVFKGNVFVRQPLFFTVLEYIRSRFLRELGFKRHITPIFAVGAGSNCEAEQLPWRELAD